MADGEELLIIDGAPHDRDGLRKMFSGEGYVCSAPRTAAEARDLIERKFFPAVVLDLDVESPNGGLQLMRFIRERSAPTRVVVLTSRRSFEGAVEAMRLGAVDIVLKRSEELSRLSGAVQLACDRYHAGDKDSALLREVRGVLEDAFKIMVEMGRKVYREDSPAATNSLAMKPMILIVDDDAQFLTEVSRLLESENWEVAVEMSGGSGLDKASTFSFQIIAAREELADLPGQMLLKSVQAQQAKTLGLLYSTATSRIERYEGGRSSRSDSPFRGPPHLVEKLTELVAEVAEMRRERRYLQAFRAQHGDFVKRYAELKVRIDSLSS